MFVGPGFSIVAACGRFRVAIPAIAPATRLIELFESIFDFLFSTIGKLMSFETCVDRF